jgi:hypothetical protein
MNWWLVIFIIGVFSVVNPACIRPTESMDMYMILYISLTKFLMIQTSSAWATDFHICTKLASNKFHEFCNTIQIESTKWQTVAYPTSIHQSL